MSEKHTDGAVRAATIIVKHEATKGAMSARDYQDEGRLDDLIDEVAAIIDQETDLPEITAERDKLREALQKIVDYKDRFDRGEPELRNVSLYDLEDCAGIARAALAKHGSNDEKP